MTPDQAAAAHKAKALARLADSTTFEAERQNARDAYFRLCDRHDLDPQTLESIRAEIQPAEPDENRRLTSFFEAQGIYGPDLDYETWLAAALDSVLSQRRTA